MKLAKKIKEKIKDINVNKNSLNSSKFQFNNELNLYIDLDNGKLIEEEGKQYFTFPVYRESEEKLENILFTPTDNGELETFLIKYNIKREDFFNLTNEQISHLQADYSLFRSSNIIPFLCVSTSVTTTTYPNCDYPNGDHGNGVKCSPVVTTVTLSSCLDGFNQPLQNITSPDYSSSGSGSGFLTATGGNSSSNNSGSTIIITTPTIDETEIKFIEELDSIQLAWWFGNNDIETKKDILSFYSSNALIGSNNMEFILQFISQSIANPNLTLDFEASKKSPANIDLSNVQGTTEAEKKLRCVYEKLTQSPTFKNLFLNTFEESNRINVKLEIVENLTFTNSNGSISYPNGTCQMTSNNNVHLNTIKISTNILNGQNSNIEIAKTILHEFIHAYLNIKKINCANGATLPQINNKLFSELIKSFYQDNCFIDVNGNNQGEHTFIFDYMLPVFQQILNEVKNLLIPQNHIQLVEEGEYVNNLGEDFGWNWQDFFRYTSLNGLHNTQSFIDEIQNNPNNLYLFNFYNNRANQFSKTCN